MKWLDTDHNTRPKNAARQLSYRRLAESCRWALPYITRLQRPLSALVVAALCALLCGLLVAPQGYVVCSAVSFVIAIGCLWPWLGLRGVSCQIRFVEPRTEEGRPTEVEITIANHWPWPVWGLAIEGGFTPPFPAFAEDQTPDVAVSRISGWSRTQLCWQFTPEMRGRYPLTQPRLVNGFPFGLWKAEKPVEVLSKLIVWPLRFRLPPLLPPCGKQSWAGQANDRSSGRFGQRSSVREYCLGDSMRQIHWAKTAQYDKLVSYDREGYAFAEALVSLDTHPSLHRGGGPDSSVEWSVRIAASICDALLKQRISVKVVAHSGHFHAQATGARANALFDWLATLGTESTARSIAAERARTRSPSDALSIHITTNHSTSISGDSIVFVADPDLETQTCTELSSQSWMKISGGDVASQVRTGWQRSPRRRRRAV